MKSVKVNALGMIKSGPLEGIKGIVCGFDSTEDEVIIQISEKEKIITCSENIYQSAER